MNNHYLPGLNFMHNESYEKLNFMFRLVGIWMVTLVQWYWELMQTMGPTTLLVCTLF